MMTIWKLTDWSIRQYEAMGVPGSKTVFEPVGNDETDWIEIGAPKEVQEALMENGLLETTVMEDGEAEYCKWVAEKDWAYRCTFGKPDTGGMVYLNFKGLDTIADIYLNGAFLAECRTMYLPVRVDVTGLLEPQNELLVYFHSPYKMLDLYRNTMPEEWKGIVNPQAMLRKSNGDFGDYYGAKPCFTPIGIFEDVCLEIPDKVEITHSEIDAVLNLDYTEAVVTMSASGSSCGSIDVVFELCDENGTVELYDKIHTEGSGEKGWNARGKGWSASTAMKLADPKLWWPKNHGDQPLYKAIYSVYSDGVLRDKAERVMGFRDIKLIGSLKFQINGRVIRFWGANIAPIGNITHRWDPEPAIRLIDLADKGNMNILRIWGPSKQYGEELYLEADRRGIMLWQDFPTCHSQLPDTGEYKKLFLEEAEFMIRRLKNHPSILLWCGGNENIFMAELMHEKTRIGLDLLTHDFRLLCQRMDPHRYYHDSCPAEGKYTNDPLFGDSHGSRATISYVPGEEYAIFLSEDIRTYPPQLKSLKRFVKEESLWPEGYQDITSYGVTAPMPKTWLRRTMNNAQKKFGPIERFYDATDAESLVYRFAAAAGLGFYETLTNTRRGKPHYDAAGERRSTGHMLWKLNNTWPQFYCGLIDYYEEVHIPYYSVKNALEPFLLTFDVNDHIYLWGVNDTSKDIVGTLDVKLFNIPGNRVLREFSVCAAVPSGESRVLTDLDSFGQFERDNVLYAVFTASDGRQAGRTTGYVDMERHLVFPNARLELSIDGDCLIVKTDAFARCVELSGSVDGDEFGWYFEDNYFDLLPFEQKRIKISGRHDKGVITAKAHYSDIVTSIDY